MDNQIKPEIKQHECLSRNKRECYTTRTYKIHYDYLFIPSPSDWGIHLEAFARVVMAKLPLGVRRARTWSATFLPEGEQWYAWEEIGGPKHDFSRQRFTIPTIGGLCYLSRYTAKPYRNWFID